MKLLSLFRTRATNALEESTPNAQTSRLSEDIEELKKTTLLLAERIEKIGKHVAELSKEVSKLSDAYGLILEDTARLFIPSWLLNNMNIEVTELSRAFFQVSEKYVEVDFYGIGFRRDTRSRVVVFGEVKSRIHREDLLSFLEKVDKIVATQNVKDEIVVVIYGLYIHPSAVEEATKHRVILISPYTVILNSRNNNSA